MGIVPEFISKLVSGGKKDNTPVAPSENIGPSAAMPESSVSAPPFIGDPLVTSVPKMPDSVPVANAEPVVNNTVSVETPLPTPTIASSVPAPEATAITTDTAPTLGATPSAEQPAPNQATPDTQQAA